jgi:hypothetical protein
MAEKADKYAKLAFVLMASDSMSDVLKEAAENAKGSFSKIEQSAARMGNFFLKSGTHMRLLGEQIGKFALNIATSAAAYGDSMWKSSQKAGMGAEEWQKLAYAASYSDVELDALTSGMSKFNKYIAAAAAGYFQQNV